MTTVQFAVRLNNNPKKNTQTVLLPQNASQPPTPVEIIDKLKNKAPTKVEALFLEQATGVGPAEISLGS